MDTGLPKAKVFLADRRYDSDHIRNVIALRGGIPVIPGKTNRKVSVEVDAITYALRNRVERCFNKLKCHGAWQPDSLVEQKFVNVI